MLRLANNLGVGVEDIANLDAALRHQLAKELGLTTREACIVDIEARRLKATAFSSDPSGTSAIEKLADHLSKQELREIQPFRLKVQQLQARREQWATLTTDDLKAKFLNLAKDRQLSPMESILGQLALFATHDERRMFGALLINETETDKIPQLNLLIAAKKGEVFLQQNMERHY
jgi:hypothetical protein